MTAPRSDADAIRAWVDEKDALKAAEQAEEDELRFAEALYTSSELGRALPVALEMVRVLMEAHRRISGMSPNAGTNMLNESLDALSRVRRIAEGGYE